MSRLRPTLLCILVEACRAALTGNNTNHRSKKLPTIHVLKMMPGSLITAGMDAGVRVVSDDGPTNRSLHQLTAPSLEVPSLTPFANGMTRSGPPLECCITRFNNSVKLCNYTAKSHDAFKSSQLADKTTHDINKIIREVDENIKNILREANITLQGKLSELQCQVDRFAHDVASSADRHWYREVGDLTGLLRCRPHNILYND